MNYEIGDYGDEIFVRINGNVVFDDHEKFREILNAIKDREPKTCIFDTERIGSMDSAGVGMLMVAYEACKTDNRRFLIRKPTDTIRNLMEIVGHGDILLSDTV
ncbi:MAG: STAS domain-containing protein [Minwuia sp.]|nr:STAS domain-containing protein [Minwuia sp.]